MYKIEGIDSLINDIRKLKNSPELLKMSTRDLTKKLNDIGRKNQIYSSIDPVNKKPIEFSISLKVTTSVPIIRSLIGGNISGALRKTAKVPVNNAYYHTIDDNIVVLHNIDYKVFFIKSTNQEFEKYLKYLYTLIEHEAQHFSQYMDNFDKDYRSETMRSGIKSKIIDFFKTIIDNSRLYHNSIDEIEAGAQTTVRELLDNGYDKYDIIKLIGRDKKSFSKKDIEDVPSFKFRDYRKLYNDDEVYWNVYKENIFLFLKMINESDGGVVGGLLNEKFDKWYTDEIFVGIAKEILILMILIILFIKRYRREQKVYKRNFANLKNINKNVLEDVDKRINKYFTKSEQGKIKFILFKSKTMAKLKISIKNGNEIDDAGNKYDELEKYLRSQLNDSEYKRFNDLLKELEPLDIFNF